VYYLDLSGDTVWWDGYTGQKCVVIEEFYGQMKIGYLLKLLDRYPMQVQTKGSYVPFLAEVIFFTSNEHPRMWYGKGAEPGAPSKIPLDVLAALERRFQGKCGHIKEFKDKIVIPDDDEVDAEDLLNTMIGATEMYNSERDAGDADDDVDDKEQPPRSVIDLTCDEELDRTPDDAWQEYPPSRDHAYDHYEQCEKCYQLCADCTCAEDAAMAAAAQQLEQQHEEDEQVDLRRATKLRRTDTTRFEVVPPPKASAAEFRKHKQIPGQSKLALIPTSSDRHKVNDDDDF